MSNSYNTPGACGVYLIESRASGKRYIGSSRNIEARWARHRYDLRAGCHHSPALQRAYAKYGEANLRFEVLETCSPDECVAAEQRFIDEMKPEYNVSPIAGMPAHTDEVRARISVACRAAWIDPARREAQSRRVRARGGNAAGGEAVAAKWQDPDWRVELLERRAERKYEAFGGLWTLKELAETYDVPYGMLRDRARAGWPLEHAIVTPKRAGGL